MANNKRGFLMNCSCGCKSGSMKEWNTECVEFRDLKPGDFAEIVGYREGGNINYKFKLLAMGLLRNRIIKVLHVAPFGDPVEILVMSYRLSLRKQEASVLKLKKVCDE